MSRAVTRLAALALAAAFATLSSAARAAEPFEINVIVSETGSASFLGKAQATSLSVLEDLVNTSGGIAGRTIHFDVYDDQSNPQVGVQLMNSVIAKGVSVVLGGSIVAVCGAIGPLAANGPVNYCLSPGVHPPAGSYIFSSLPSTTDAFVASATYFRERGIRKIALITSSDATGQDAERGIDATFNAQSGVEIVVHEHFNITDVSVAAQLARIKASDAQAMIAWSTGTPIATILRGAQDLGFDMPIEVSNGNLTYAQMHAYAGFLPKEILFAATPPLAADSIPNGPVKRTVTQFMAAFKAAGVRPDTGYLAAWDPAAMIVDAYKKLGPDATALQLRDYLENLRGWVGINGIYDFKAIPQRGIGANSIVMVRWDATKDTWVAVSRLGGEPLR